MTWWQIVGAVAAVVAAFEAWYCRLYLQRALRLLEEIRDEARVRGERKS